MSSAAAWTDYPGDFDYIENAFSDPDAIFGALLDDTPWRQESIVLFGKKRPMPRLTCWMGDAVYTYSGLENTPVPWLPAVVDIKRTVEELSGAAFNGVLLNLYRDGADSMGWHADDEATLGSNPVIASVSLGASRRMRFKAKIGAAAHVSGFEITLAHGSVLVMRGDSQRDWLHAIPKSKRVTTPRINLTFRNIVA